MAETLFAKIRAIKAVDVVCQYGCYCALINIDMFVDVNSEQWKLCHAIDYRMDQKPEYDQLFVNAFRQVNDETEYRVFAILHNDENKLIPTTPCVGQICGGRGNVLDGQEKCFTCTHAPILTNRFVNQTMVNSNH